VLEYGIKRMVDNLWNKYTNKKLTLEELAAEYGKSHVWIRDKNVNTFLRRKRLF
jgi:hypothetical protein